MICDPGDPYCNQEARHTGLGSRINITTPTGIDLTQTGIFNNTLTTTANNINYSPHPVPTYSSSYTSYTTVGNQQLSFDSDTYDTTDARYRLPGLPPTDQLATPLSFFSIFDTALLPYANNANLKFSNNVAVTYNYNISLGNPSTFNISGIGIANTSDSPVIFMDIRMSGGHSSTMNQTVQSGFYNFYEVDISSSNSNCVDVGVRLFSPDDYNDIGYRYINSRIWSWGSVEPK